MASFSLDDIRAAAEAKYGSTDIGDLVLENPLRLPKLRRDALNALQGQMGKEESDEQALLEEALHIAAKDHNPRTKKSAKATALIKEIGGDLAVLATIFEKYVEGSQVGEASASDD